MRATAGLLSPASRFWITSLREQTGVSDHLCRCVCTAAPPAVVAAPQVVVLDLSSDEEQVNKKPACVTSRTTLPSPGEVITVKGAFTAKRI